MISVKLEKQVVSLELAKKLKELDVKQESLFGWGVSAQITTIINFDHMDDYNGWIDKAEIYSAFTASELGEMLPAYIDIGNGDPAYLQYNYHALPYYYKYGESIFDIAYGNHDFIGHLSETDCRAKMLIYLIENGLMEVPNV